MARVEIPLIVQDSAGSALSGASVQVNLRSGPAATVYAAETGTNTLANPLTTDAQGRAEGWLERGAYNLVASHASLAVSPYTEPFDAAPAGDATLDNLWLPDGVVDARVVAEAIKNAAADVAALRKLGTGATDAAAGNDPRFLTSDQKAAAAGTAGSPSSVNKYVTDSDARLSGTSQPRQVKVTRGALSIANATVTTVGWDAETYDLPNNDQHSNTANTSRLTCVEAGLYRIGLNTWWAANATGYRYANIILNGATTLVVDRRSAADGSGSEATLVVEHRLALNDYVEAQVLQSSGAALNFTPHGFWMSRAGS